MSSSKIDTRALLKAAYLEIKGLRSRLAESDEARSEPIAVVGVGCRFPGGASDADKFWSLLRDGVDVVGPVPPDRWDTDALYDPDPDAPGKLYVRHGAFLDEVDRFDAAFFGISPVEARSMDPQQRLLLEVAWEALENAGLAPDRLRNSRTGIFIGLMYQDYLGKQLREGGLEGIGPYLGTGTTFSAAAGRLSYVLGFHGPCIAVDTACSSSLVSIHLACQSLRNRECDAAIAGGANVMVMPEASINLSKARMMSPTGKCRTFDAAADGYTRGEGCGLVVLKRLGQARADGDRILGLIRGSAVNQDGDSNGMTAPNGSAQRVLLRDALAAACAKPDDVGYIECHGTGTPLGDPIEVSALLSVYGQRAADNPLAIGSVKTNFGHLESAAGICGLIKALLVLRHREVPPHLHLETLNPRIDLSAAPVVIPTRLTPWFTRPAPRLAAVSAFGFAGTNAHVVLEAFDEAPAAAKADRDVHVLTLSASSEPALRGLAERYADYLDNGARADLGDICFTANTGRSHLTHRLAAVGDTPQALKTSLTAAIHRGTVVPGEAPGVAFLFGGEGSLPASLGRRLYETEPLFRETFDACDALLQPHLDGPLTALLFDDAPLTEPAQLALGYSLFVLWRAWGIEPSVVVGRGVGELIAGCAAGILGIEDAIKILAARSRPDRTLDELGEVLRDVTFHQPVLPIVSIGTELTAGDEMTSADYWLRRELAHVPFGEVVETLRQRGETLLLAMGPVAPAADIDSSITVLSGLQPQASLAALYVKGAPIDWAAIDRPFARRKVALPTYAFQRERYWIEPSVQRPAARRPSSDLLGERQPQVAHDPATIVWEADLDRERRGYLAEHKLFGTPVWPIAAQIELALSAAREGLGLESCRIAALEFVETLYSDVQSVQTVLVPAGAGEGELRIYSRIEEGGAWVLNTRARIEAESRAAGTLEFSTMFFAAKEEDGAEGRYRLIVEAAKYADRMGFRSVWVPERHFTHMGSLYPNPSVLHAALARETHRVRLMAGSVVLPLHNPLRVAEEWAMVDNLSGGRVGISLASGWNPNDFVLAPGKYDDRYDELYAGIEMLRRLWRGETLESEAPSGKTISLRTYPTPVQRELPLWITAARSPESFRKAGSLGANLLTHLLDQDVDTLAGKIALYRAARAENGFDPDAGVVTVMCHTFIAPDLETVHRLAKKPFCDYLKSSKGLLAGLAYSRGQDVDIDALSDREMEEFVEFLYERFRSTRALIGTPESCLDLADALRAAGVNEIACLLDFGPTTDEVLEHLPYLNRLREGRPATAAPPPKVAAEELRARCNRDVSTERFYDDLSANGVVFDGSLRRLGALRLGGAEALAEVPGSGEPAIAIDACLQAALATFEGRSADAPLLVPSRVRAIRSYGRLTGRTLWSHARRADLAADITVFGEDGNVVLEIEGLEVKSIPRPSSVPDLDDWLYEVAWRPIDSQQGGSADDARPWIILQDRRGMGLEWAKLHAAQHLYLRPGAITEPVGPWRWTVNPADGFDRVFSQIDLGAFAGILDLWPLDAGPVDESLDLAGLEASQRHGLEAATALIRSMANHGGIGLPRLWLVTRGAQSVAGEEPSGLSQSPLWGFAGALAREHNEWWGGIVDLDAGATAAELDLAMNSDGEDQIALRDGRLHARRIIRATTSSPAELPLRPDAAYVIAGGQGGLGLAVARWMIERGARHLLLLGRSPADASVLGGLGIDDVRYEAVDIADEARLGEVLASVELPIRGVVHAAGVFHDEALLRLDRELLWKVMRARVSGAWALHRVLAEAQLDFFVLFSSFSALTPPHGQASYAAASSFLDALAHYRRAAGKPALSINWGAWSEVGFAATDVGRDAHAQLEAMGMRRMTPRQGLEALEHVMRRAAPPQIAIFPMDLRRAAAIDPALERARLLAELSTPSIEQSIPTALLAKMEPEERAAFLRDELARIAGEVLEIAPSRLDVAAPLTSLGLDSLIAVHLKNRMQKEVGLVIPLVNALRGGSVSSLVDDLMVELRLHAVRPEGAFPPVATAAQQEIEI